MVPAIVINLDRRSDRWLHMKDEWGATFAIDRFSATDGKTENLSFENACRDSHIRVLLRLKKDAQISLAPFYIVMEDDVVKTQEFQSTWPSILSFVNNHDMYWDFIALDPILSHDRHNASRIEGTMMIKIEKFRSMGFLIYSRAFLLNFEPPKVEKPLDMTLTRDLRYVKLTPNVLCVRQLTSINSNRVGKFTTIYDLHYNNTVKILKRLREGNKKNIDEWIYRALITLIICTAAIVLVVNR